MSAKPIFALMALGITVLLGCATYGWVAPLYGFIGFVLLLAFIWLALHVLFVRGLR